jgi:hypothetical protein
VELEDDARRIGQSNSLCTGTLPGVSMNVIRTTIITQPYPTSPYVSVELSESFSFKIKTSPTSLVSVVTGCWIDSKTHVHEGLRGMIYHRCSNTQTYNLHTSQL